MNCHGCKYLDRDGPRGNGYCMQAVLSKRYHAQEIVQVTQHKRVLIPSGCVRTPDMERCELYRVGKAEKDFRRSCNGWSE